MIKLNKLTEFTSAKKGITLVALVITIVVLLILAGVTINMLLGNDGIIAKAKKASDMTKNAMTDDEMLAKGIINGKTINELVDGESVQLRYKKIGNQLAIYLKDSLYDYGFSKTEEELEALAIKNSEYDNIDDLIRSYFGSAGINSKNELKQICENMGEDYNILLFELARRGLQEEYISYIEQSKIKNTIVTVIDPNGEEHKIQKTYDENSEESDMAFDYLIESSGQYKFTIINENGKRIDDILNIELENKIKLHFEWDQKYLDENDNYVILISKNQCFTCDFERGQTWREFIGDGIEIDGLRIELSGSTNQEYGYYFSISYNGINLNHVYGMSTSNGQEIKLDDKILEEGMYEIWIPR